MCLLKLNCLGQECAIIQLSEHRGVGKAGWGVCGCLNGHSRVGEGGCRAGVCLGQS